MSSESAEEKTEAGFDAEGLAKELKRINDMKGPVFGGDERQFFFKSAEFSRAAKKKLYRQT